MGWISDGMFKIRRLVCKLLKIVSSFKVHVLGEGMEETEDFRDILGALQSIPHSAFHSNCVEFVIFVPIL